MKKKLTVFLSLLCVAAMLLPTVASALPMSDYTGQAEALKNHAFYDYFPTYTGNNFDGYSGPYTVGSFPLSDPTKPITFHQLIYKYSILGQAVTTADGDGDQWNYGGIYLGSNKEKLILANDYATTISYHAPENGIVKISMDALSTSNAESKTDIPFGSKFAIFKNGVKIWPTKDTGDEHGYYVYNTTTVHKAWSSVSYLASAQAFEAFPSALPVQKGDVISFAMAKTQSNLGIMRPRVTYTTYCGETYSYSESFCGLQGGGGYYAGYSPKGSQAVYAMPSYDGASETFGGKSGAGTIGKGTLTVESGCDTVLLFRSPIIATYKLTSPAFATTKNVAFTATIYRADGTTSTVKQSSYTPSSSSFGETSDIYLDRGDVLAMRFSANETASVTFDPTISSTYTVHATSKNGEAMKPLLSSFALAPDICLDAVSASLAGDISLHLYAYFSEDMLADAEEYGVLIFPEGESSYTYNEAYALSNGVLDADSGEYRYTITGIAAKEMTDLVYARPYVQTANGYRYGELRTASVRSYAESLHSSYKGSVTDEGRALYTLSCAMLNYGAEAQTYFGYKQNDLANTGLDENEKQIKTGEYTDITTLSGTSTMEGIAFHGASLILDDLPAIRVYVATMSGISVSNVTVEVSMNEDFSSKTSLPLQWSEEKSAYYVTLNGIPAARMRTPLYFRITDGTGVSQTLTYSAESYAARSQAGGYASLSVTERLFAYADAAEVYATVSGQAKDGIEISAQALADAIRAGTVVENGVYHIKDASPLLFHSADANTTYDAKNITVYITLPLTLNNTDNLQLSNLHLVATNTSLTAVRIARSNSTVLENVTVSGHAAVGISLENASNGIFLRGTDVAGEIGTGISLAGGTSEVYITNTVIDVTTVGIEDASTGGAYIKGNEITADMDGVVLQTNGSELRDNTIAAAGKSIYIKNAVDVLVARNTVIGSIICEDSDNVVILKNTATTLTATANKHLYTVSNTLSGRLTLTSNNYMIADLNVETAVTATDNQNHNGDDVTDVDARLAYGADESLLPHVDKDQFLHYERKTEMRVGDGKTATFSGYVAATLAAEDEVIIAPGAYTLNGRMIFNNLKDKTIYAFGVMLEQQTQLWQMISVENGTDGLAFIGLTIGFARQSCGQVYVLEKMGSNQLRVLTGAGMVNEFGNTDPEYYDTTGMGAQRQGTFYAYCDTGFNSITKNSDGTMTMAVSASVYSRIEAGDILTCRATNGGTTIAIYNSADVSFRDMVIYGNASGFAFVEGSNKTATTYYRVADTTKSGALITKEEYDRYRAMESAYGVSLEVSVDDNGNYRGSLPHIGSIDATHTTKCKEGSKAISCLFENMCDDGTNQNAQHGRLHAVTDNGDGTTTITYKGNFSEWSYSQLTNDTTPKTLNPGGLCHPFTKGDRVYIYTSAGQLVCDTPALTDTTSGDNITIDWTTEDGVGKGCTTGSAPIRYVTVATSAVNFAALNGYDLSANSWKKDNKVLIDNMSMASNGFLFDNTLVRNIRSRGLLIKASDATIKNCSLINIGMGAVAIHYEILWGESGVTENLNVQNNLIQHTGYFKNQDIYSPVSIYGLGTKADEDYLLYKNINITGNHIVDRTTDYAVYVNSAKDITIENNYFGPRKGYTADNDLNPAIHIFCAKNVEISGNTYPTNLNSASTRVKFDNASYIYGTDINGTLYSKEPSSDYRPTLSGTTVTYKGNWDYGYMPTTSISYTPYNYYDTSSGWIVASGYELWDGTGASYLPSKRGRGGFYATHEYRMAAQRYYNVALRYTAPQAGTINIALDSIILPSDNFGGDSSYFAIFKNNQMIWPGSGSYYTNTDQWYTVSKTTDITALKASIGNALTNISVAEGDEIYFVSRRNSSWSSMAISPTVIWHLPTTLESSTMAVGTANWPSYTAPTVTGDGFNGSFDGFNGKWTIGYLPLAGGAYTTYGAMFNNSQSILMPSGASSAWSHGGMYLPEGRFALVSGYATALTYHATMAGNVSLTLNKLMADSNNSNVVYGAKFAIFVNGERVWPTTSNAGDPNGYYVYTSGTTTHPARAALSFLEAAQAYEPFPTNLSVKAGDLIQFAMVHGGSEMGYCEPCVTYK
ncbi:MAG: right-handed parallel beta-helix repeat-containing protein [Clostridia bacterium]|nr:right-handed parallel beta-helix repeat-containing protein [Clostridia bacterium]